MGNHKTAFGMLLEQKYLLLVAALLAMLVFGPAVRSLTNWEVVDSLLNSFLLIAGVVAVSTKRRTRWTVVVLAVVALFGIWGEHAVSGTARDVAWFIDCGASMGFLLIAALVIIVDVMRADRARADNVMGLFCAYALLGASWAYIYAMIETLFPTSFHAEHWNIDAMADFQERLMIFRYYSFTTLTTLGFGDIVPLSQPARTFSWLEAMTGQFYIAVLVSRLVSKHSILEPRESMHHGEGRK